MTLILAMLSASGADAISLQAVRRAQLGLGAPSLTVVPSVSGTVSVSLTCSGRRYALDGPITPGEDQTLLLEGLPEGAHTCSGTLSLAASNGSTGEMPLSLQVDILPPLTLVVERENLDLTGHALTVSGSRPLDRLKVEVFGEGGAVIGQGERSVGGLTSAMVEWDQNEGEAITLTVTGWDEDGLPGKVDLSPWSYAIPHEDVHFASGSHDIPSGEAHKLEAAFADLEQVLAKYGAVVEVQLFVVGYTDTVGPSAANLELSGRRARSIALWFRGRGFQGPVTYQGLGESVLAVPTPDQTEEPANRRVIYLLAAEQPVASEEIPTASWTRL